MSVPYMPLGRPIAIPDVVRIPEVKQEQEMIDAYKVLCDALFTVLTIPHHHKMKEAQEYEERMKNLPSIETYDYSVLIDNLTKERDLIHEQMAVFEDLEEPLRTMMSAYLKPQAEMSLKRIEDQLDGIQKQMEQQQH